MSRVLQESHLPWHAAQSVCWISLPISNFVILTDTVTLASYLGAPRPAHRVSQTLRYVCATTQLTNMACVCAPLITYHNNTSAFCGARTARRGTFSQRAVHYNKLRCMGPAPRRAHGWTWRCMCLAKKTVRERPALCAHSTESPGRLYMTRWAWPGPAQPGGCTAQLCLDKA